MINFDDLKQILREKDGEQILSVYLRTDAALRENQADKPAWRIWLKNVISNVEEDLTDEQQSIWKTRVEKLHAYLDNQEKMPKSVILFFGETFERTFSLPVLINDNHLTFGEVDITPLVWVMDEYERYVVALIDSENARVMTAYLGNMTTKQEFESDIAAYDFGEKTLMPRSTAADNSGNQVTHGSNRDSYEDMIGEHTNRFYRDIAEQIEKQVRNTNARRIILGGSHQSAHAVQDMLHDSLKNQVIDIVSIPVDSEDHAVMEHIVPKAIDFERQQERVLVEDVIDLAKANSRAVLGHEQIEEALTQQRVELLITPWGAEADHQDIVKHLVTHTVQNGGDIEFVHGEAAELLKSEGGMAARLYYTI